MGTINKIKLPSNVTYDIVDSTKTGIYTVKGTQTATTQAWTGAIGVSANNWCYSCLCYKYDTYGYALCGR